MSITSRIRIGPLPTPRRPNSASGAATLDASGEKYGFIFAALEDITISHLAVRTTSVATPPVYRIGLQGISSSVPDGTFLGGGSPASATWTPSSGDNWVALDNPYSASRGEMLAGVVEYASGTIGGSNRATFAADGTYPNEGLPYWLFHNGTSWARQTVWNPMFGYRSSTRRFGRLYNTSGATLINSSGHRAAAKFSLPNVNYRVVSVRADLNAYSNGSCTLAIWDDAGNVIQSATIDMTIAASSSSGFTRQYVFSGALGTLRPGKTYYIGFQHTGTAFWLDACQLGSADETEMYAGSGQFILSIYNGSAWSDDTDNLACVELEIETLNSPTPASFQLGI